MREFNNVVDEVELFGVGPQIQTNLNQNGYELEVINNDEFENAGYEEDSRKRMLRNLNKKVSCSSRIVHVRAFFV